MADKIRVFLGGTCNGSKWREQMVSFIPEANCFNPVVPDWTEECMIEERRQRKECDICLYVITPEMTGVYSIAEAIDDSNKRPEKTVFVVLDCEGNQRFSAALWKSLKAVGEMVERNGGKFFQSYIETAYYINKLIREKI